MAVFNSLWIFNPLQSIEWASAYTRASVCVCTTALACVFLKTHKRVPFFLSVGPVGQNTGWLRKLQRGMAVTVTVSTETQATGEFSDSVETETARQMFGKSKTKGERGSVRTITGGDGGGSRLQSWEVTGLLVCLRNLFRSSWSSFLAVNWIAWFGSWPFLAMNSKVAWLKMFPILLVIFKEFNLYS